MKKDYRILLPVSILAGTVAGLLGYSVGQYFYALFVFPFILLAIGLLLFLPALRFFKTPSALYNAACGLLMGLALFAGFHYTEYFVFRSEITARIQAAEGLDKDAASTSLDAFLKEKTGIGGFLGFTKYQQSQWRPYVYYFIRDGEVASAQDLVLRGRIAWLYLGGEAAVLLVGSALLGYFSVRPVPGPRKRP
jgi:hypothetical protein